MRVQHGKSRRGVALMLVLIAVMVAAIVGYSYLAAQGTSIQITRNLTHHSKARYVAESGLELAIAYVLSTPGWRSEQTEGVWVDGETFGEGAFTVGGEDGVDADGDGVVDGDGDLADSLSDPVTLTVTGNVGGATAVVCAVLTPDTGPPLEAGVTTVGGSHHRVSLENAYTSPVVVCTVNYRHNAGPVVARVSNVTERSFDVRLQNPSGEDVVPERVSYVVMEEGEWTIGGLKCEAHTFESSITDDTRSWVAQQQHYQQVYTKPVVLGQVMTEADADWSVFWCHGFSSSHPPSATRVYAGKTVCEDSDTKRNKETIGYIVFEAGNGRVRDVAFESDVGPDRIQGVSDGPPYLYDLRQPFSGVPAVIVANVAGMNDADGGWAVSYGDSPATASQLRLAVDEDQLSDEERSHSAEQVGYLVFECPVGASAGSDVYFGYEAVFEGEQKKVNGKQIATLVSLNRTETVTAISAYVAGPPPKKLRYAIYEDVAGEPGDLLVETPVEEIGSNKYHWHTVDIAPTVLGAGAYWLAVSFEHNNTCYRYTGDGGQRRYRNHDAVGDGFSTSWGHSSASDAARISMYAICMPSQVGSSDPGYSIDWRN